MAPAPMADLDMVNAGQSSVDMQAFVDTLEPTEWEQLKQQLNGMPPDQQEAYLMKYAADNAAQGQQAQGRMDRADAMRTDSPRGRYAGGMYVAANPLEHIGAGMQNYQASKQYKQGQTDLNAANTGAQSQLAQMLRMKAGL